MSDIYLSLTETPAVVTLSQPVVSGVLSSNVTVTNVVSVNVVTMPAINVTAAGGLTNAELRASAVSVAVTTMPALSISSVSISNFPAAQVVTGTVALDAASLAALESVTVTVGNVTIGSSVSVSNFPSTQTIAGTVTVNAGVSVITAVYNGIKTWALNEGGDGSLPISISGSVNVSNQPSEIIIKGYDFADDEYEVLRTDPDGILYVTPNSPISVLLRDGLSNLITSTTSGTKRGIDANIISSSITVSGTVTANIGVSNSIYGTLVDFNDIEGFRIQPGSSVSVSNSVTIGSLPTLTPQLPRVTFIDGSGSVTTANTAVTVFASSSTRSYLLVQVTTGSAFVNVGATATTLNGINLTAGQGYAWETTIPQGAVSLISTTTSSRWVAKEA